MQPSPPSKPTGTSRFSPSVHTVVKQDMLGFSTAIREVPETVQRPLYDSWKKVKQPHLARANVAVTELSPDGTTSDDYNAKHSDKTVSRLLRSLSVSGVVLKGHGHITGLTTTL